MRLVNLEITSSSFGQEVTLHPTVIQNHDEMLLIDCGYEGSLELLSVAMEKNNLDINDLTGIIISHDDIDHLGGLFEIKEACPAVKVYSSSIEAPYVSGEQKSLRLQQSEDVFETLPLEYRTWALEFQNSLKAIRRISVDHMLDVDTAYDENINIVHTPGHTPGHISLYIPAIKTLIANDALVIENGELEIANPQYTLDINQAIASIKKLSSLEINTLYCYHGGMVADHILEKLQKLLKRYRQ